MDFLSQTFLLERLMGVSLYIIVTFLTYTSLRRENSGLTFNAKLNICLIALCVMAFFYVPPESADLYRIREWVSRESSRSFVYFTDEVLPSSSTPGARILYYIFGHLEFPGLLPAFVCLVYFYCIFHIFKEEKSIGRSSSTSLSIAFLFFMAQGCFLETISGIRSCMAFSIVAKVVYDDFCLQRKSFINYFLCLVAASIHPAPIPIIISFLPLSIYDCVRNNRMFMSVLCSTAWTTIIITAIRYKTNVVEGIFAKADSYTSEGKYFNLWEYIIVWLSMIILARILVSFRKHYKSSGLRIMYLYAIIMFVSLLPLCMYYTIFHRYSHFLMYVFVPIMAYAVEIEKEQGKNSLYQAVKYGAYLILILACTRGNLCGYKFFLLE